MLGFGAISEFAISQVIEETISIAVPAGDPGLTFLIDGQYHNGSTTVSYYLSGGAEEGWTSPPTDTPANQYYEPRIIDPGNFERHLFSGGALRGKSSVGAGDIVIANGDPGNGETLDSWLGYGFDGRTITIRAMKREWTSIAQALTLFSGRTARLVSTSPLERLELRIKDQLSDLDKPLLTTVFAGTTTASAATAEGNADLKGQIKQRVWGSATNVALQPANVYDLIYLASNSAMTSITVYDGGIPLTNDGDDANIATLQAATIASGHYRTCLASGLVRLGAPAAFVVTADIVEGSNAAARTAGQIAYRMMIAHGIDASVLSVSTINDLDARNSAVCYSVVTDGRSAIDAIQEVLDSIGAWMIPNRNGIYEFGRFEAPTYDPNNSYDLDLQDVSDGQLQRLDVDLPCYRVTLKYGRVHRVQDDSEVAGIVTAERRATLGSDYRSVVAEDTSVQTKHPDAIEIEVVTNLSSSADATTEVARLLALLKVDRSKYSIALPLADAWPVNPGMSITLTHPRLGMSSGFPCMVLSRTDDYVNERLVFEVWG